MAELSQKDLSTLSSVGINTSADNIGFGIVDTNDEQQTEKSLELLEGKVISAGVSPSGGLWLCCLVPTEREPVMVNLSKEQVDYVDKDGNKPYGALSVLEWEQVYKTTPMGRRVLAGWVLAYDTEKAKDLLSELLFDWRVALLYNPCRKKYDLLEVWK